MKKRNFYLSFCIFCISLFVANAQNTLNGQYQQLKEESNNYQEFKVIKQTTLDSFWGRVQDSVSVTKKKLVEARQEISTQKAEITQLQQQVKQKEDQMQKNDEACQQVSVIGVNADKNGYVTVSYVLYGILLAILGFFFFQYQNSNRVTVSTRKDFDESRQQVDDYKKKLLDTQTSLGRELQTERNRVDELQKEINSLRNQLAK